MSTPRALLAATALAATLTTASACYGSYGAYHKLHGWNGDVSHDKWGRSALHLGLWIVPVYELAILGDFLVFNTIEHFTGTNPFH